MEEGIIIRHEKYFPGTTYAQDDKWYKKVFQTKQDKAV